MTKSLDLDEILNNLHFMGMALNPTASTHGNDDVHVKEAKAAIEAYINERVVAELQDILYKAREHTIPDIEMIAHHTQGQVDFIEAVETEHIIGRIKQLTKKPRQ